MRNSCDMLARNSLLYLEVRAKLLGFFFQRLAGLLHFLVLAFHFDVLVGQQLGLVFQFRVGLLQFLLLALQFAGQGLRLLEQIFGAHVRFDGVQHDADGFGELIEERLVRRAEAVEAGQFHDRLDAAFKHDRKHDDVQRLGFAQAGGDLDVIAGHVGQQDLFLFQGALADQSFAELEAVVDVLAFLVGIAGQQLEIAARPPCAELSMM